MKTRSLVFVVLAFPAISSPAQEVPPAQIANWPAPSVWQPAAHALDESKTYARGQIETESALTLATSPMPFIAVTPCRIVDTRLAVGAFGVGETRTYAMSGGALPCVSGFPPDLAAVSLNVTVAQTAGTGFVTGFPTGGSLPVVSSVNWIGASQTLSNAAVVPTGTSSSINVFASQATHVILDVNGYYAGASTFSAGNTFLGSSAGNSTMTGTGNTGIGANALMSNAGGIDNIALGVGALQNNISGNFNTTVGSAALNSVAGDSDNIALGDHAGSNLSAGSNNIYIGSRGNAIESNTTHIGAVQTSVFIAGVNGATSASGVAVLVNSTGHLGTTTSSRRFKEDIRDIAEKSDGLLKLRPVVFKYKSELDPTGLPQYGLIAEDVAEVYPDLVVYDREGRPETVRYHFVNALLLNEVKKQHRTIEALNDRLAKLEARLTSEPQP